MNAFDAFVDKFGLLLGMVVYILLKDVIPFIKEKWLPARMQADSEERASRLAELSEERKWHRQMESERLEEMKKLTETVQAINLNLAQLNAETSSIRIGEEMIVDNQRTIIDKQDDHHNATMDAIGEMREEVARRKGIEEGKKMPKTGPIGGGETKLEP
jgi:hypothetical protein